jgi:hypothetical protein
MEAIGFDRKGIGTHCIPAAKATLTVSTVGVIRGVEL